MNQGINAISTDPIKEKLRNLQEYMPNQEAIVYEFGRFLAGRLKSGTRIAPDVLVGQAELALYDLEKGVNGYTGEPLRSDLVGYPFMFYRRMETYIPDIVEAVCPLDFAASAREFYKRVHRKMGEQK